jgi:hypothetical protein
MYNTTAATIQPVLDAGEEAAQNHKQKELLKEMNL